jgi:hypothetical protein
MFKIEYSKRAVILAILATFIAGGTVTASAESQFDKDHPHRAEVNKRLHKENAKTAREVKSGKLTQAQGQQLHQQDHQIRQEERDMASQNGGHITKQEQATLNQQENSVNQQRRQDIQANKNQ